LGKSGGGQKDLWLVRVADPDVDPAQTTRLLVLCRQHGDEPASTEAVLRLIHQIARGGDPALANALPKVTLYLVPMLNPDGADANTRANGAGADLNRDWGVFSQPETRLVARAAGWIQPHFVLDAHNWDGGDHYNANCLEIARAMLTPQGKWLHSLQGDSVALLAQSGYALHPTAYGSEIDPHLAHRYFASKGLLAALVETHSGDPQDKADFQQRQGLYLALIHGLARRAAARANKDKPALDRLAGYAGAKSQEPRLFPPLPVSRTASRAGFLRPLRSLPAWFWVLGLYGFTLWAGTLSRRKAADSSPVLKGWAGRDISRLPCTVPARRK
jgi:hypothetical protein